MKLHHLIYSVFVLKTLAIHLINEQETFSQHISLPDESFLDSIFGELVNDDDSLNRRDILIKSGITSRKNGIIDNNDVDRLVEKLKNARNDELYELIEKISVANSVTQQELYNVQSHEAFKLYKSKLNLPDKDDTSDICNESENLFGGIVTFGHFPHFNCFNAKLSDNEVDIAIIGAPFDTGTSYRPGARFGPEAIRSSGRRLLGGGSPARGNRGSPLNFIDPYDKSSHNLTIIDCGDVPMTPFDNRIALNQLYRGLRSVYNHPSKSKHGIPKVITMGGDHTITLLTLKAAYEKYGKVTVLHFDSHIDTWDPKVLGGGLSSYMSLNHGTFLHYAHEKGYLAEDNFHVGLRAPFISTEYDKKHDSECGFHIITARDLDTFGFDGIISKIKEVTKDSPVYISVDIDVLDPANAPGTGTMEIGGFTGRELLTILDGLQGINLIGGDVVEVSPPFDTNSEITSLAATSVIDSFLGLMILTELD